MIVWSGLGIIVPIFFFTVMWIFTDGFDWEDHGAMLAMFPTALFCYLFGSFLNKDIGPYGENNLGHTFFFIRIEYWSIVCTVIGIIGLIKGWK